MQLQRKCVAIIGRPNVGKSTIFNRLTQSRDSITHNISGVTRDRIYGDVTWKKRDFILIDTGGIQAKALDTFQKQINAQAQFAMDEANIIIFVISYNDEITKLDQSIASLLKKNTNKPIILAVNKYDGNQKLTIEDEYKWKKLGFGKPFFISSSHGINIGDLLDDILAKIDIYDKKNEQQAPEITFSLVGKPNVGKSSVTNALLKKSQVIISDFAGTTRDSIYIPLTYENRHYTIVDTAGIKRVSRTLDQIEQISIIKTKLAIERSNFCVLILDGAQPISKLDFNIADLLLKAQKPFIILINKSDLLTSEQKQACIKDFRSKLDFVDWVQIFFISALKEINLDKLFLGIRNIENSLTIEINHNDLSLLVGNLSFIRPLPKVQNKQMKLYDIKVIQKKFKSPIFLLYVNYPKLFPENYKRFIIGKLRLAFKIQNVPIYLKMKEGKW